MERYEEVYRYAAALSMHTCSLPHPLPVRSAVRLSSLSDR